jgi:hypothetical protein
MEHPLHEQIPRLRFAPLGMTGFGVKCDSPTQGGEEHERLVDTYAAGIKIMTSRSAVYPDILGRKQRGRERLASLSFSEKIRMLEAMRGRDEMIRKVREARLKKIENAA